MKTDHLCRAADGVTVAYSRSGGGEVALVFVHGGLANRGFWDSQVEAFAGEHTVVTVDLAGHGDSGADRVDWSVPQFGADVRAVADAEGLQRMVLVGNSLGAPVAVEAALLMPGRVLGVVAVDTYQSFDFHLEPEGMKQRAAAFRADYTGCVHQMVKMLFHTDADPEVMADAERRMQKTPPDAAAGLFLGMAGYDPAEAARRLTVPLIAINGDMYPTDVAGGRAVAKDFDAVIMEHMGHYPMLERPEEFNAKLASVIERLRVRQ
ncbi:MAG: alpha/beta hydrolase [Acidobacteria bacterium]|nr:alpha/beta hydrolase [Acidobacteriota bacterium]